MLLANETFKKIDSKLLYSYRQRIEHRSGLYFYRISVRSLASCGIHLANGMRSSQRERMKPQSERKKKTWEEQVSTHQCAAWRRAITCRIWNRPSLLRLNGKLQIVRCVCVCTTWNVVRIAVLEPSEWRIASTVRSRICVFLAARRIIEYSRSIAFAVNEFKCIQRARLTLDMATLKYATVPIRQSAAKYCRR